MNYVLIHGAWHGGWCWRHVARILRRAGHEVHAPTLTGLGERAHLLTPAVNLSTMIDDVCAVLEAEELEDAIMVGHSFGGHVLAGAADRMPQRMRRLVFLDALVVPAGASALSVLAPEVQQQRRRTIDAEGLRMAIPTPDKFGVSDPEQAAWLARHLTPHPLRSYEQPLQLRHPLGNGLPKTYVAVTDPWYAPLAAVRAQIQADAGWHWRELAAGHDAMVTSPESLAALLLDFAEPA